METTKPISSKIILVGKKKTIIIPTDLFREVSSVSKIVIVVFIVGCRSGSDVRQLTTPTSSGINKIAKNEDLIGNFEEATEKQIDACPRMSENEV